MCLESQHLPKEFLVSWNVTSIICVWGMPLLSGFLSFFSLQVATAAVKLSFQFTENFHNKVTFGRQEKNDPFYYCSKYKFTKLCTGKIVSQFVPQIFPQKQSIFKTNSINRKNVPQKGTKFSLSERAIQVSNWRASNGLKGKRLD